MLDEPKSLSGEKWKYYNEKYLLSNKGRWYSIKHNLILKDRINNSGYSRVLINNKHVFTHIKVVQLFGDRNGNKLPNEESLIKCGLSIDHVNGNKQDNAVSNLEIVTHQENCIRRSRNIKKKNALLI